jgi:hypothetical protein
MMITQSDARNNHTDEPASSTGRPKEAHTGRLRRVSELALGSTRPCKWTRIHNESINHRRMGRAVCRQASCTRRPR